MWKAVGSVHSGDDKSMRSNRSRVEFQAEPFHQSLKRRSNLSPETNRSFCQDYFDRHRHNTLNMTGFSNKSEKNLRSVAEREDMFTEMRNKASKDQMSSRVDSLKDNPEGVQTAKTKEKVKVVNQRVNTLKKDQNRLKNKLEKEFTTFKNFFYQLEEKVHEMEEAKDKVEQMPGTSQTMDEQLLKGILGQALDVEKYFSEMDRKKALIMQDLN